MVGRYVTSTALQVKGPLSRLCTGVNSGAVAAAATPTLPKMAASMADIDQEYDFHVSDDSDEEYGISAPKHVPKVELAAPPPALAAPPSPPAAEEPPQPTKKARKQKAPKEEAPKQKAPKQKGVKKPAVHKFNTDGLFGMSNEMFADVEEEFKDLSALKTDQWTDRAYKCRERAKKIFRAQKKIFAESSHIKPWQKLELEQYKMVFDRGTRRLGVCHYPDASRKRKGYIGLSAALVDNCAPAKTVTSTIVHELTHAVLKGAKHNQQWQELNYKMGGDGKAKCSPEVTKGIVKHRVEVYCGVGGAREDSGHFFRMRMAAPARSWLRDVYCRKCWEADQVKTYFSWKRV